MIMSRPGRKMPPGRTSGHQADARVPLRPQDARTLDEALTGLIRAGRDAPPNLQHPSIVGDSRGCFLFLNGHEWRAPAGAGIGTSRAGDHDYAVVTNSRGRTWLLIGTADGVRELVNLPPGFAEQLRQGFFGR
jgi:hypothetical protein